MAGPYSSFCLAQIAGSITKIFGISGPEGSADPIGPITGAAQRAFDGKKADRVFIYNPDAIALWLFQKYTAFFEDALVRSSLHLPILSVMPSVTPVCFASMYTGLMPAAHGIQSYVKPVLKTDTVFDALIRAGMKPAIISTTGDSISKIFLDRRMDYYIFDSVEECNEKAFELIRRDEYDLITLYNGNYDAAMHRSGPESAAALGVLRENVSVFKKLHEAVSLSWKGRRTMLGFCPDHGCHEIDGGMGSHGLDMAEDMNVIHFFEFLG